MSADGAQPTPTLFLLGRYAAACGAGALLVVVVSMVFAIDLPAMSVFVNVAAAELAASSWLRRAKAIPATKAVWAVSAVGGLLGTTLMVVPALLGAGIDGDYPPQLRVAGGMPLVVAFLGLGVLNILVARLGFWRCFRFRPVRM